MKTLITILTITFLFSTLTISAQRDKGQSFMEYYTQPDKLLHGAAGFGIAGIGTTMYATARPDEPLINAAGVGFLSGWAAGGLKELSDWKLGTGTPDHGDVMATMYGAALGAATTALSIKISRKWNERRANKQAKIATDPMTGGKVVLR